MTIACLTRTIPVHDRFIRFRSAVRDTVARPATRQPVPTPAVNAGRWATLPGEYAGPWRAPMHRTLPPIMGAGITAAVPCPASESLLVHLAGRWAGRVLFEGSADGAAWSSLALLDFGSGTDATETARPGIWRVPPQADARFLRFRVLSLMAGTIHLCVAATAIPRSDRFCFDPAA